MEKVYVIQGNNDFLIREYVNKLIGESSIDGVSIIRENAVDYSIKDLTQELFTISFFDDKKMIIVENIDEYERYSETELKGFINYLKNPQDDIILVMTINKGGSPQSLLIGKVEEEVNKYAYLIELENIDIKEIPNFIKELFNKDGYEVTDEVTKAISDNNVDLYSIYNEVEKIKAYFYDTKVVTKDDLLNLLSDNMENNIYHVSQALLSKNIKEAIRIYNQLVMLNYEPTNIVSELYRSITRLLMSKRIMESGGNSEDLISYFNISKGAAYYLEMDSKKHSRSSLENLIIRLQELDYQIKSGKIDKKLGLELFILGAMK